MSGPLAGNRLGFSLLELITAMLASTVLVTSLAATVVISTQLLEVPPDDEAVWHDRFIADRLAADLRYATRVDDNLMYGFEITRPDAHVGSPQTVTYQSHIEGLTRQVTGGPTTNLDRDAPNQAFFVDGYSAATYIPSGNYARVRSSSTAATDAAVTSVDIDIPPGCMPGDLVIVCVSAKTPDSLTISESGWQTLSVHSRGDLHMIASYRTYDVTWPSSIRITASPASAMAAAMVSIEDVDDSTPINWSGVNSGYAWFFLPATYPRPLETSGFNDHQLNVQMFAAELDPWIDGALGMAGFTDVLQATAAEDDFYIRNTIGIAVRNGATPDLSTTTRLLHQGSGNWLQTAARVEAVP